MPRGVRVLERPLLGGPRIVAAVVETRIVLSGTRITLGRPRSTTIRSWTVAAHTVIVLDRLVGVRDGTAIVDRSIAEALTWCTTCTVVCEARILAVRRLTLVSDPGVVGNWRLLGLRLLSLWCLTLIGKAMIVRDRRLLALRSLTLVSDAGVVGHWRLLACRCLALVSDTRIACNRRLLSLWCLRLVGDTRIMTRVMLIGNGTTVTNRTTVCNRATVIDGTLISSTRVVARMTLIRNRATISDWTVIGYATLIGNGSSVVMTVVSVTVMTGHCTGTRTSGCSGTGSTGSGVLVAMRVDVGIELIGTLELAFLLETLLLGKTIAFSGVSVQLLGFSLLALSLCGLNLSVGIGLLGLSLAVIGVRFPSMDFMLGLSCLLTDPGGLLALVFALLSCGLSADRDDDADDNQNNDDRNDYPDNGSCTHALSPCCLFGSH
ncbi:hypothetical protein GCM10009689_23100 [Brevibacterium antiquum]|uniref:hypothetical protein n=1 Tax=Brevibacterium antiquum TaxID=234835 RepID=UPI0018DFE593|nr:hypothetical protein [Brevibacterium antiquum]